MDSEVWFILLRIMGQDGAFGRCSGGVFLAECIAIRTGAVGFDFSWLLCCFLFYTLLCGIFDWS